MRHKTHHIKTCLFFLGTRMAGFITAREWLYHIGIAQSFHVSNHFPIRNDYHFQAEIMGNSPSPIWYFSPQLAHWHGHFMRFMAPPAVWLLLLVQDCLPPVLSTFGALIRNDFPAHPAVGLNWRVAESMYRCIHTTRNLEEIERESVCSEL